MKQQFRKLLLGLLPFVAGCGPSAAGENETEQSSSTCLERLLQPSLMLVQKMKSDGIDLTKPRLVTHLLRGADDDVRKASRLFSERGFEILESSNGRLLLGDEVPLSEEWIQQTIPAMCFKGDQFNLVYDGWDVDVSGDNLKRTT